MSRLLVETDCDKKILQYTYFDFIKF